MSGKKTKKKISKAKTKVPAKASSTTKKQSKKPVKAGKKRASKKTAKRATKKPSHKASPKKSIAGAGSPLFGWLKSGLLRLFILGFVLLLGFTAYSDIKIRKQFEGQKWALPAHVYTRPMELYLGQRLDRGLVQAELEELGYQERTDITRVGSYRFTQDELAMHQREFQFWDGLQPRQQVEIELRGNTVENIRVVDQQGGSSSTEIIRIEPRLFGSVSPLSHEDRTLLKLEDVPPLLIDALISIEDRQFYSHFGINPLGIARAMVKNIAAGKVVQGGSTLTQQLVKNYYLNSSRTIRRKLQEIVMAVLLEVHYSKDEILQAYLNEVFLSQAGNRAIHGFALGSQYFFGRPLEELDLPDLALLAGIIKGPSYYNPMKNPQRAKQRRDLVLKTMLGEEVISQEEYQQAVDSPLRIDSVTKRVAPLSYPAFSGYIGSNLKADYRQADLANDGLQIYTTLDPRVQSALEINVTQELTRIEKSRGLADGKLQVAAVVIRTDNGEVAAMMGDRRSKFSGFNRALSARRPVGSLLKPFVFLTALEQPEKFSLATPIEDTKITVSQRGSPDWQPNNYDGEEHGQVMLIDALAKSYNLATVQLGMELGVSTVSDTIRRLGYEESFSQLPSLLLGAVPMSVMDVGQLYLTLASGGFKTPIKGVRSVLSNADEPLSRYPLAIEQVVEPEHNNLINYALQEVVRSGTARSVLNGFQYDYGLAGKTGTTDEYRDSWFAGFSGNYLTVIWVGRDDNKSTGLTGASGAARLWSKVMQNIPQQRLELPYHENIIPQLIYYSQDQNLNDCSLSRQLPMLISSLPLERLPCAERMQYDLKDLDEDQHFEPSEQQRRQPNKRKKQSFWKRIFG
jgi:penicillin-binding protein 1B